ncbi:MAG: sulfite exporter TauE/SafE family protein [Vicinamibacterales bacterium]
MAIQTSNLTVKGMHCSGCEQTIEQALERLPGVIRVNASSTRQTVETDFDEVLLHEERIRHTIEESGYQVGEPSRRFVKRHALNGLLGVILLLAVGGVAFWGRSLMPDLMEQMTGQVGYAVLFSIGFLTGFHCIGMCGGFVVSYSTAVSPRTPTRVAGAHLLYALGKTTSYVLIGAGFGLLGSLVTITPHMRGFAALAASVFVVLYGLKMLAVFSFPRRFTLRLPEILARGVAAGLRKQRNPLVIGLLTGLLLGCGPLQAMYVMSAGTGSATEGAAVLFFFGLGTLVPLLSFGLFASILSRNIMNQLVRASGILMIVTGVMMADRGLKLIDSGYDFRSLRSHWRQGGATEPARHEPVMPAPRP